MILITLITLPKFTFAGAKDILQMGVKSVLIKGGHTLQEKASSSKDNDSDEICDVNEYAQDYFLSTKDVNNVDRLCDGSLGVWIRGLRYVLLSRFSPNSSEISSSSMRRTFSPIIC